jgi:hypothetical protein
MKTNKVYLIGNAEHKMFKVGFAQDVEKRRKALLISCPLPLEIKAEHTVGTRDEATQVEHHLHTVFASRKIQGEWFTELTTEEFLAQAQAYVLQPRQKETSAKNRAIRMHALVKAAGMCQSCFKPTERGHAHKGEHAQLWVCTDCRDWLVSIKPLKAK